VWAALVNYKVKRKNKESSSNGILTEALTVRGRGSNRKGKGERERSKSRSGFKNLKENLCAFCKELGHWKIDCPMIKNKNKESKTKANLARVINTQSGSTSHAGELHYDTRIFSFSITTPTIGYSGDSKWMLDTGAIYHVCPNRNWFSSFEKLDGCFVIMGDNHPCNIEGICMVHIKMFDGMVWELKEERYVSQLKRNLISVGALEALGLEVSIGDSVLKMTRSLMVVLNGYRRIAFTTSRVVRLHDK